MLATIATDRTQAMLTAAAGGGAVGRGAAGSGAHHATGPGAQHSAAALAGLNAGYARAFEVAAVLTLAALLTAFVVPAIRESRSPSGVTGDQTGERPASARHATAAGADDAAHR